MSAARHILIAALLCLPALSSAQETTSVAVQSALQSPAEPTVQMVASLRPVARDAVLPNTRWYHIRGSDLWTKTAMVALKSHGATVERTVPSDIDKWCPAYRQAGAHQRRQFWVGLMSTLAKHESTYRPHVSGDSGKSHGLFQIRVPTAQLYGCNAQSKAALLQPVNNVSCAIRIMSKTVPRDQAVSHKSSGKRGGMGADWGPFVQSAKREDMRAWVKRQDYCQRVITQPSTIRPVARPAKVAGQTETDAA